MSLESHWMANGGQSPEFRSTSLNTVLTYTGVRGISPSGLLFYLLISKLLTMNKEDKMRLVNKISETLTLNKLENRLTENGDNYILAISQIDIPKDGLYHEHLRRIVNTTNFIAMKIGQFNLIFVFDISESAQIL